MLRRSGRLEHCHDGGGGRAADRSVNNHYAKASGDRAQFGWPLDDEIEKLRADFVREADPKKQLQIAEQVQKRIMDLGVTVPLGQFVQPLARRKGVTGNMESPITVFSNIEKK